MHRTVILFSYFLKLCIRHSSEGIPLTGQHIKRAARNEFPYVVSLSVRDEYRAPEQLHFCGGALITAKHVLTAAHCVEKLTDFDKVDVKVSHRDLAKSKRYQIQNFITYKKWVNDKTTNKSIDDIAIVKLTSCVRSNKTVALTNLSEAELDGKTAWIAGWGDLENDIKPRILMVGQVEVSAAEYCLRNHNYDVVHDLTNPPHRFLCTSAIPALDAECGDSGSPLILKTEGEDEIIGVTKGACYERIDNEITQRFNIHMSTDYYKDFIIANTRCEDRKCCIL